MASNITKRLDDFDRRLTELEDATADALELAGVTDDDIEEPAPAPKGKGK